MKIRQVGGQTDGRTWRKR